MVIHYPTSKFKVFYRLIPNDKQYKLNGKIYGHDDKSIIKNKDVFAINQKGKNDLYFDIGLENKYKFDIEYLNSHKDSFYPEIHYFHNSPSPINYDYTKNKIDLSAFQMREISENDLFSKLLSLKDEKNLILFCILLIIVNIACTVFVLSKVMAWIK